MRVCLSLRKKEREKDIQHTDPPVQPTHSFFLSFLSAAFCYKLAVVAALLGAANI